ncbi:hypothetical protein Glove_326g80 [Diversispora epigaea]|uniref:Protein kinase domain-containing protein n=1 Tax=Diversispora epigaea TaxID=1348612 RepID=A0A397HSI5_9GLOM|nr:hypothetical protein Glove_326g80 [Diversispora epigaea]
MATSTNKFLPNQVLKDFNKLLKIKPNDARALRFRGETYQKLEKYIEVLTDFNKLIEEEPNNTLALSCKKESDTYALKLRGETFRKLEMNMKALTDFDRILKKIPSDTLVLRLRGETYQILGWYNEALIDFNQLLEKEPNNALVLKLRKETTELKANNVLKERIIQISGNHDEILGKDPNNTLVLRLRGEAYQKLENRSGFGVVNSAIWIKGEENEIKVALKNRHNSKDMTDDFLKEVISHGITSSNDFIIQCYGIIKDPDTNNNIMVMEFAEDGSLHQDLLINFDKIAWQTKLERLYCIATGLEQIHNNNMIHRDLHSGNILMGVNGILGSIRIADLGLCRNIDASTNYVYGVIPYVAPEIFEDSSYSQASDIYSFGILMWEFTSGHRPFFNRPHNSKLMHNIRDRLRPEIIDDTPEVFINLMKKCWDSNALNRTIIIEIREQFDKWCWGKENEDQFIQAEQVRKISVELKFLEECEGNNYSNYHPEAIYRSRPLNSVISLSNDW